MVSPNAGPGKEDKLLHPDDHLIWCSKVDSGPCMCGALERERASCTVEAATFVKLSGNACIHTHEWQLLGLNMGLNGNF